MEFKAYHGSDHQINKFSDEFAGGEGTESAEGAGIYFSNSKENAKMWGKYIYTVVLRPRKVLSNTKPASEVDENELKAFLDTIEDEDYISNRHQDIESDKWASIQDALAYNDTEDEVWHTLAGEHFTSSQELVRALSSFGYDMQLLHKKDFKFNDVNEVYHYVILNPKIVKIVGVVKKVGDTSDYEDVIIAEESSFNLYKDKQKSFSNLKSFDEIDSDLLKVIIDTYGCEGFNDEEDAYEEIYDTLKTDYPNGYANIPDTVTLYRILCLENPKKLKKGKEIGNHWLMHDYNIDMGFLDSIGVDCDYENLYVITAEMPKENIGVFNTIASNLNFPREYEVTLKSFNGINIKKTEPYESFETLFEVRKIIRETIYKSSDNIRTLYHGTDYSSDPSNMFGDPPYFFSTSKQFAEDYGTYVYEADVNLGKVFDSTSLDEVKKIYDAGYKLTDPYMTSGDGVVNIKSEYYDYKNNYYPTAEHFINGAANIFKNTWEAIESTYGVIDWITSNGYDSILITEDGIVNYLTWGDINGYNQIEKDEGD